MPTPLPPGLRLGVIAPQDAIDVFRQRKLIAPAFSWQDVWQAEHADRFTVAKLARADLLQAIRTELDRAIAEGRTLQQFADEIRPRLARAGWWGRKEVVDPETGRVTTTTFNPARLQLIYEVNIRQSYAAGRWKRIERNKSINPYIVYRTMRDERVRASHRPWEGVTLPVDHPFWDTHYPPNGWRCRCTAYATDQTGIDELRAAGFPVKTTPPAVRTFEFINKRTGEIARIPHGIDPGFAYNAGKAAMRAAADAVADKLAALPAEISARAVREVVAGEQFARFYARPEPRTHYPVGYLAAGDRAQIGALGPVVRLSADQALKQRAHHPEIAAGDYVFVQDTIDRGRRVREGKRTLIFVLEDAGWVSVVKTTMTGEANFLTSFRRLSRDAAERDREVRRLLGRGGE